MEEIGKYIWLEDEEEHGWVPGIFTTLNSQNHSDIGK